MGYRHFHVPTARDVRWAHAVNSRAALAEALRDERVHMLEADLLMARGAPRSEDGTGAEDAVPTAEDVLMCHPPSRASDLTFREFLDRVTAHLVHGGRPVGVKLDFKELDCVAPCLALMRARGVGACVGSNPGGGGGGGAHAAHAEESGVDDEARVRCMPVWLNADVVRGPGGRDPIAADAFVEACVEACPEATLSLGWTHTGTPVLGYTQEMVDEMLTLVGRLPQHVTFAASAAHLYASASGPRESIIAHVNGEERPGSTEKWSAPSAAEDALPIDDAVGADHAARRPRSFTLWGPAPWIVRRWMTRELHPERTYVDVKECTRLEMLVIHLYAVIRPLYSRFA